MQGSGFYASWGFSDSDTHGYSIRAQIEGDGDENGHGVGAGAQQGDCYPNGKWPGVLWSADDEVIIDGGGKSYYGTCSRLGHGF